MHGDLTQELVREFVHYNSVTGVMTWNARDRKWFTSVTAWRRWNNRYANTPAFTYVHSGRRWGCLLNRNYLAHRVAWLHARGAWPDAIKFVNDDATDLRLRNMVDAGRSRPFVRERLVERVAA